MAKLIQQVRQNSSGETPRYRVWNAINPPEGMDFYSVENPEEAYHLIEELIQEFLVENFRCLNNTANFIIIQFYVHVSVVKVNLHF